MKNIQIIINSALIFEVGNFGDELLRMLMEETILKVFPSANIKYISLSDFKMNKIKELGKFDVFIYAPGGYMGYIEKWFSGSLKKTIERCIYYYMPGVLFSFTNKPIIMFGQGVGPYEYLPMKIMLGRIGNKSSLITVRDNKSKELLIQSGVSKDNIHVTADCSLTLIKRGLVKETRYSNEIRNRLQNKKKIFVLYFELCDWKNKIIKALSTYRYESKYAFVIGGDSLSDTGIQPSALADFTKEFPKDRTYTFIYNNPIQLISIINECDIVVTPKFHTGIIASVLEKSVFSFSVQYDKNKLFYNKIGFPERVYDFFTITSNEMAMAIEKYKNEKVQIPEKVFVESQVNFTMLEQHLKSLWQGDAKYEK